MLNNKIKQVESSLNNMIAMCDDRISILKEEEIFDSDYQKQVDEQISHYQLLKADAMESLKSLQTVYSDILDVMPNIKNIVNYLYEDEHKNAMRQQEENGDYEGHIFASIEEVDNWITEAETGNYKIL